MRNNREKLSRAEKPISDGKNLKAALGVTGAAITILAGLFFLPVEEYQFWPQSLQLSSWILIPAVMALWGVVIGREVAPSEAQEQRLADILPKSDFLKELRRERLRSDRSKTPLSIALFCFAGESGYQLRGADIQQFMNFLRSTIRETDILSYIGNGRIGLLLVDTDAHGCQAYTKKLLGKYGKLPVSMVTASYPDQVFDQLLGENPEMPAQYPFFLDAYGNGDTEYASKRLIDLIGAIVALVLFSPVMLATAAAIKLTSPGPVIFRQIRLGRNGLPFVFYKFRSMAWQADDRVHREYVASLIKGDVQSINQGDVATPLYKLKADPRVTPVGRIIRKTSIDELPQLFNVLKGEMSLVGPRPPLPYEAESYQSWHLRRILGARPGLTGLWQVEGRCRTTFDDMVRLDLTYIRNCSLALDLKILLKTVKVVLLGVGAT